VESNIPNGFFVSRLTTAGLPDPAFGSAGYIHDTNGVNEDDTPSDVLVDPSGRIIVAGTYSQNYAYVGIFICRFLADGSRDPGFGINGAVSLSLGSQGILPYVMAYGLTTAHLVLQTDGRILLTGTYKSPTSADLLLARLLPNGALDNTFGTGGKVVADILGHEDHGTGVATQPDGKIIVSAASYNGTDLDGVLLRYLPGLILAARDFSSNPDNLFIYPNPVADHTELQFENPGEGMVKILLEDMQGRVVGDLFSGSLPSGKQIVPLQFKAGVAAGTYVCRLVTDYGMASIQILKI
jgi:uncharacterized delta-60 repeat protein